MDCNSLHKSSPKIDVIIPAFNEAASISYVINDIPRDLVEEIVVVNNGSLDETDQVARKSGATVVSEDRRGYGYACLKGIEYLKKKTVRPDIVVFLDADYSDSPAEMKLIIQPFVDDDVDFVIGSRALGEHEKGAMLPQQIFGNWLATRLIKYLFGVFYTDLGPFRAINFEKLLALDMQDKTFGWTVEMQVKTARNGFSYCEVPVSYKKRIGVSKITGTLLGTIKASYKILYAIFKYI